MTAIVDSPFARVTKETIVRDYSSNGALTWDTIAYDATNTINEKIDSIVVSGGGNVWIQFEDEWVALGTQGTVDTVNFTWAWVSAARVWNEVTVNISTSPWNLDSLSDVTITTPANGQALTYNWTQWINSTPAWGWDVTWPASATDNALARFDSTTWKLIQNWVVTESDDWSLWNVNSVIFDQTYTWTPVAWELYWNSDEKTLNLKTWVDNVITQLWREHYIYARNSTWSTIVNGSACYITWASWNFPTVAYAQANDYNKSSKTIGIATMDIPNWTEWLVTTYWYVRDLNTSWFAAGDILYLSSSVSWGITNVNPTWINYTIRLGYCITSNATTWIILVDPKEIHAFESDEFKVVDSTDKTKQWAFVVSWITAGTKRQYTLPNADTTLIGTTTTDTLTNKSISLWTNTITSTFAQLNTAVTDADLARTDAANTFTGTQTITQIDLGNTDTSITRLSAWEAGIEGKRILTTSPLVVSAASYTTDTGTSLNMDNLDMFIITAQAGALLFNAPWWTLVQWRKLVIRIKDNWTARALTWNAVFRWIWVSLPSTTVPSKTLYLWFIYNSTDTKWDLVANQQEV